MSTSTDSDPVVIEAGHRQRYRPAAHQVLLRAISPLPCAPEDPCFSRATRPENGPWTGRLVQVVVGEIVESGSAVDRFPVGHRVAFCAEHAGGDFGEPGAGLHSAEYVLVSDRPGVPLYPIEEAVPTWVTLLLEPFAVACRAVQRARPAPGESAVVFGAGTVGIGAAIALQLLGCGDVLLVDDSAARLRTAARLGFATCHSAVENLRHKACVTFGDLRASMPAVPDVDIFVATCEPDRAVPLYQSMGKSMSRLVIIGNHAVPFPVDAWALTRAQQQIIGSAGYTCDDVLSSLECFESQEYDLGLVAADIPS